MKKKMTDDQRKAINEIKGLLEQATKKMEDQLQGDYVEDDDIFNHSNEDVHTPSDEERKIMQALKAELDRLDKEGADLHTIGLFNDNTLVAGRGMIDYWYDIIDGEIVCDAVIMDNDCEEHFIMSMTFDVDDICGAASAIYTFGVN